MRKITILFLSGLIFLCVSFLAACAQPTPAPIINTPTPSPTRPTSTPLPTWTPIPSFTPLPTITPMPTATIWVTRTFTPTTTFALPDAKILGLAWYDDYDLLISIQFPTTVKGNYTLKLEDKPYTCEVLPKYPDRIYCKGRGVKVLEYAEVSLFVENSDIPLFKTRVSIPLPPTFYR
mgnify:CR=1 FL=1